MVFQFGFLSALNGFASETDCGDAAAPTNTGNFTYSEDWFAPSLLITVSNVIAPQDSTSDNVDADEIIDAYLVVLYANITYCGGMADYYMTLYQQYYYTNPALAASYYALAQGFQTEKENLENEDVHWDRFKTSIENIREAKTQFIGIVPEMNFYGKFSYLKVFCQTGCIAPGFVPTWDTMPENSVDHRFIISPYYGDDPTLIFMFDFMAAADGNSAYFSSRYFLYLSPYFLDPVVGADEDEITIEIEGVQWIQSTDGSLSGIEKEDIFNLGDPYHVTVKMESSAIDGDNSPSWDHTTTINMTLFEFDFTINKETYFDEKCALMLP